MYSDAQEARVSSGEDVILPGCRGCLLSASHLPDSLTGKLMVNILFHKMASLPTKPLDLRVFLSKPGQFVLDDGINTEGDWHYVVHSSALPGGISNVCAS